MNTIVVFKVLNTNKYHPTIFYPSPKPSEYDDEIQRHFSSAHHTDGFDDVQEAMQCAIDYAESNIQHTVYEHICLIPNLTTEQIKIYLPIRR